MILERITMDEAEALLQLPRHLGDDPSDGVPIYANNGRYGPYVQKEKDYRNIDSEDQLLQITLAEALAIFSQPKVYKRGGGNMAAKGPLREFGTDPGERDAGRGQGRSVRCVRHRRRDQRLARQGRPPRSDGTRTGVRTAGDPARGDHRQGWPDQEACREEEGTGQEEGCSEEVGSEEGPSRAGGSQEVATGDHRHLRVTPALR